MTPSFSPEESEAVNISGGSDDFLIQIFAKLDKMALGVAVGVLFGFVISTTTIVLIIKGGDPLGPNLGLLGQYFIGYTVTVTGSIIGFVYGFVAGFILGWFTAFLRNSFVAVYLHIVKLKAHLSSITDFINHL
jgi:hypothetical protein